jgi:hypothetical protein
LEIGSDLGSPGGMFGMAFHVAALIAKLGAFTRGWAVHAAEERCVPSLPFFSPMRCRSGRAAGIVRN